MFTIFAIAICLPTIQFSTLSLASEYKSLGADELTSVSKVKEPATYWQKSDWWLNGYFSSSDKKWLKSSKDKKLNIIAGGPRCPTSWRGYYGYGPNDSNPGLKKWLKEAKINMKGFPDQIIKYCTTPTFIIRDGKITNHPSNIRYVSREIATVVIKDMTNDSVAAMRAIQENDYLSKKTGGQVFNENLQHICDFKFTKDDVIIKCKNFGIFPAKMNITNVFKGEFKIFGQNDRFAFFITNLNLQKTKAKYSEFFKTSKGDECKWNCG